jgi:hypothetical protein
MEMGKVHPGRRQLGGPRPIWESNIKMDLREVREDIDWIDLVQDKDRLQALVNPVISFWVP